MLGDPKEVTVLDVGDPKRSRGAARRTAPEVRDAKSVKLGEGE